MIKTLLIFTTVIITTMCGSLWGLGYLAFRDAHITGVNIIPASIFMLVVFGLIFFGILVTFNATDWLNDWIAQRSARTDVRDMRDVTSLLKAQTQAMAGINRAKQRGQVDDGGGLVYDESTFDPINL